MGPRRRPQRSATQNSPSSPRSVHPTPPAYQPRSMPSRAGISGSATDRGSPPTAGVGWRSPASSSTCSGRASCARIGVARCWTFWTLASPGSSGCRHPEADRRRGCARCAGPRSPAPRGPSGSGAAARRGGRPRPGRRFGAWYRREPRSGRGRRHGAPAARGWLRRTRAPGCPRTSSSRRGRPPGARRAPAPGSWSFTPCTRTSRASTIFWSSPAAMRSTARPTAAS